MFKLKRADILIYIIYLNPVSLIQNVNVKLYSIEAVKIQLSKKYKDYTDIFSEKKTDKMSNFIHIKYLIFIKKDKNVSFRSIYSLSINELYILHNYLNLNLIKD